MFLGHPWGELWKLEGKAVETLQEGRMTVSRTNHQNQRAGPLKGPQQLPQHGDPFIRAFSGKKRREEWTWKEAGKRQKRRIWERKEKGREVEGIPLHSLLVLQLPPSPKSSAFVGFQMMRVRGFLRAVCTFSV